MVLDPETVKEFAIKYPALMVLGVVVVLGSRQGLKYLYETIKASGHMASAVKSNTKSIEKFTEAIERHTAAIEKLIWILTKDEGKDGKKEDH